jgi:hypothetical protein
MIANPETIGGSMARGRMISRSLWGSKRFSALVGEYGSAAGLVYVACVTAADVAGRLEADGESVVDLLGRAGRRLGIDAIEAESLVRAAAAVGLLRVWGESPDLYAEVDGFHAHNRVREDREGSSAIPGPDSGSTPGVLRESSGSPPADSGGIRGSTPTQVQVQVQVQEEVEAEAVPLRASLPNVLLRAWRSVWSETNARQAADGEDLIPPPPMATYTADSLVSEVPALAWFPTEDLMAAELRRVLACYHIRGWQIYKTSKIIEKVGTRFKGVPPELERPAVGPVDPDKAPGRIVDERVSEIVSGIGKEI